MSSSAVAVDGPRYMTNMRSEKSDHLQYYSVDELNRQHYWRSGDESWRKLGQIGLLRPKNNLGHRLSLVVKESKSRFRPPLKSKPSSVFLTQPNLYENEPLIPDELPIEPSSGPKNLRIIPLPGNLQDFQPHFMLHRNFKKMSKNLKLLPTKEEKVDAVNLLSLSVEFKKKPFLRQVDIAKRMAQEHVRKSQTSLTTKKSSVRFISASHIQ